MTDFALRDGLYVPDTEIFREFFRESCSLNVAEDRDGDLVAFAPMAGGAEIFPDEGLDHVLGKIPLASTAVQTTYYLGLFSGSTATTVPARTDALAANPASVAEPSGGAYGRIAVANTAWGAPVTYGNGRRTTATQASFAQNTASWGNINGFFLATAATAGLAVFYANFDDLTAVPATVAGYTIRVTPYFHFDQ